MSHNVNEHAAELPRGLLTVSRELDREFEARLVESSTLAFRVAYSVLRHREDAEDVTQEAFAKAYRKFGQLRDRERFRAWLWRAIDALPEKLRLAVVLANVEGHDTAEVATLLDIPEGTVKSRLFLARKRLKEELK